jgi:tetratricopeptide (TPR) repeat protein
LDKLIFSSLLEKCLVENTSNFRFYLHEIIRQFANQKSEELSIRSNASQSHAEYYRMLAASNVEKQQNFLTEDTLDLLENDLLNIKLAWNYLTSTGQFEKLFIVIEPLYQFFNIRSRFQEGIELFQKPMAFSVDGTIFESLRCTLANRIGSLAHRSRQEDLAFQMFSLGFEISDKLDNAREQGLAALGLGSHYLRAKQFDQAIQFAEHGLELFLKINDHGSQAAVYELISLINNRKAEFGRAKDMILRSISISRQTKDRRALISSLNILGDLACNDGDFSAAENYFQESLALSRSYKDRFNQAILLNNLASIYHPQREFKREEAVLLESLNICREIGDRDGEAMSLNNLGELSVVRGNYQEAIQYCQQAMEITLATGEEWTTIVIFDILGEAYFGLKNYERAKDCFQQGLKLAYLIGAWDLVTRIMVNSAKVFHSTGDEETAKTVLFAALSHPGLLFEFREIGLALLETMGCDKPQKLNEQLVLNSLAQVYGL